MTRRTYKGEFGVVLTIDIDEWVVAKKITEAGDLEDKLKCGFSVDV